MPRYIDTSKVTIPKGFFEDLNVPKLIEWLNNQPTADVAPRAEVAREIIEDVATLIEAHWSEIQHGVYWLVCGRCIPLRELLKTVEKKYTEEQK